MSGTKFISALKSTVSALVLLGLSSTSGHAATSVIRAYDLTNSVGVNVHVEYTDGGYANVSNVIKDLQFLHVTHVRDGGLNPANQGQGSYDLLASQGFKFDLIAAQNLTPATVVSLTEAFATRHPGAVVAVEGPNEVNNWQVNYKNLTGTAGAQAYQSDLYTQSHASKALASVPIYNFTDWPCYDGASDFGTVHSYPKNGAQPAATLANDMACQAKVMSKQQPLVITEAGYYTLPGTVGWGGVQQRTQSKMGLNMMMDAFYNGAKAFYFYQLLDAYQDPTLSDQEKHFGLFDINNLPKALAHSLHALMWDLDDPDPKAATFTPTALNYTLSNNMPSIAKSFEVEKASGIHDIIFWSEPQSWDNVNHVDMYHADVPVTVTLDAVHSLIKVYDPHVAPGPIATYTNTNKVTLPVGDRPTLIEVSAK